MFAPRYFAARYFPPRYFPPGIQVLEEPRRKGGFVDDGYYEEYLRSLRAEYEIEKNKRDEIIEEIRALMMVGGETLSVTDRVIKSPDRKSVRKIRNLEIRKEVRELKQELAEINKELTKISSEISEIEAKGFSGRFEDDEEAIAILLLS